MAETRCPSSCRCHDAKWTPCTVFGGCPDANEWDTRYCRSGARCPGFDAIAKHPAERGSDGWQHARPDDPLCGLCLTAPERDVRLLVYDWLDLEQMQIPVLSQALDTQRAGKGGPPMPLAGAPEALQAEIHYVLTLWERELRLRQRMPRRVTTIVGAWHTTVTNRPPAPRVRPGAEVQRAAAIIAPRLDALARIEPVAVFPTGPDSEPTEVAGWEAVHQMRRLRARAVATLGRTRRTFWVPGDCSDCGARDEPETEGPLYRAEPRDERDESPVWCDRCCGWRSYDDYQKYLTMLVWPARHNEEAAA